MAQELRVFTARACLAPLEEVAKLFERRTGTVVRIDSCGRHCTTAVAEEASGPGQDDFLMEIADLGVHDVAIAGAEYLLDVGEVRGVVVPGKRRTIACRRSAILVARGNPLGIRGLSDLTKRGVRVGISALDCLVGVWEDVCGRAGLLERVRKNITFHANGCVAIVEAVSQGKVDAAFGWTSFGHLEAERMDVVRLPEEQCILRGTGAGILRFSKQPGLAEKFLEFLVTEEARDCYRKYGWETPGGM